MNGIDPKESEYALLQIKDGFVFEDFAKNFLSQILSYDFLPVGGHKDRGIDGLEHTFSRKGTERHVYQMSIEAKPDDKLKRTLDTLIENEIKFDRLTYVTNQDVKDKDLLIDSLSEKYNKQINIYDLSWFSKKVNHSDSTINLYNAFIDSYLHEFTKPGKTVVFANLEEDPRLFVFLRQQWEENKEKQNIDEILADTLILYVLEDTDPDKGIFKTAEEIKESIASLIKFEPKLLYPTIDNRLTVLATKPRKINYHSKNNGYVLPFETRQEIIKKNLDDSKIYDSFKKSATEKLKKFLSTYVTSVRDSFVLIEDVIQKLYYNQGLEFSNFILHNETQNTIEKNLAELISEVVNESRVVDKNKQNVKQALLATIREIVYNGTSDEKIYLKRLSNTYLMLFVLQCDPKLSVFFQKLASGLEIYVCTSIIIPALSEYYLDDVNKRHWNLLKTCRDAGVKMVINETILKELVSHIEKIRYAYINHYQNNESFYTTEDEILFIDEILIRAYFYARIHSRVNNFKDFIENMVGYNLENADSDLIDFLRHEFGIRYQPDSSYGDLVDKKEEEALVEELLPARKKKEKAILDARLILTIHALRAKRNELGQGSIFGYKTWWLSKDTATQKAVKEIFNSGTGRFGENKYKVSCYIRPDMLYNTIALAPNKNDVDSVYKELFPSLLGVNISASLPNEVSEFIKKAVAEHGNKNPVAVKRIIRNLTEKLKVDPSGITKQHLQHYLDELKNGTVS